jgi:hypothetical protein
MEPVRNGGGGKMIKICKNCECGFLDKYPHNCFYNGGVEKNIEILYSFISNRTDCNPTLGRLAIHGQAYSPEGLACQLFSEMTGLGSWQTYIKNSRGSLFYTRDPLIGEPCVFELGVQPYSTTVPQEVLLFFGHAIRCPQA